MSLKNFVVAAAFAAGALMLPAVAEFAPGTCKIHMHEDANALGEDEKMWAEFFDDDGKNFKKYELKKLKPTSKDDLESSEVIRYQPDGFKDPVQLFKLQGTALGGFSFKFGDKKWSTKDDDCNEGDEAVSS